MLIKNDQIALKRRKSTFMSRKGRIKKMPDPQSIFLFWCNKKINMYNINQYKRINILVIGVLYYSDLMDTILIEKKNTSISQIIMYPSQNVVLVQMFSLI
jgi:hypothetical protein